MKLHDINPLMTQSNIQCITKKAPQNRERGHEKKKKWEKKYTESKMIMAESLNSTTVFD